jgi:hypothetical protein
LLVKVIAKHAFGAHFTCGRIRGAASHNKWVCVTLAGETEILETGYNITKNGIQVFDTERYKNNNTNKNDY